MKTITVDRKELLTAIKYSMYSIESKRASNRRPLENLLFEVGTDTLNIIATNGKKLSISSIRLLSKGLDGTTFLLSRNDVKKLRGIKSRVLLCNISISDKSIFVDDIEMENVQENYPNYKSVIPNGYKHDIVISQNTLLDIVKTIMPRKRDITGLIKLRIKNEFVFISYESDTVPVTVKSFLYSGFVHDEICFCFDAISFAEITRQHTGAFELSYNEHKTAVRFKNLIGYTIAMPLRDA